MSKYRVKHFYNLLEHLDEEVNGFIKKHSIEVLKYTLVPAKSGAFIGVLEYEVEDD